MSRDLKPRDGRPAFSTVQVRQAGAPKSDWTSEQCIDLLTQGYTAERVAERTGFDVRWLRAQQRRIDGASTVAR